MEPEKKFDFRTLGIIALTAVIVLIAVGGAFWFGISQSTPRGIMTTNASPETSAQATEKDLKIKGNKASKIYHLPGCPNYNDIADRNIVWFKTTEEAESAGYRMARNC